MKLDDIIQQPGQMERIQQQAVIGRINVARTGTVVKYREDIKCVDVQLTVMELHSSEMPPLLTNVPVVFFGEFTYNISVGDECIVLFADSSTDGWWQSGSVSSPVTGRRHDLSDGFALVGVHSLPNVGKGQNLNEALENATDIGIKLYIDGPSGCLIFEKSDGSEFYLDENGQMIYKAGPVEDVNFYLDSDGYLWMEV